ncbi:MAG: trypsin-like peptidase domain-containing protein [Eggerthellaceae bacterium]|nr:trypsin-like peptidase domain-containing protein [Eggerthellaceae bacterium]MCH4220915.1 trypsin-like peptidase domain-containing protein [Eggerthellaceae bacterium]
MDTNSSDPRGNNQQAPYPPYGPQHSTQPGSNGGQQPINGQPGGYVPSGTQKMPPQGGWNQTTQTFNAPPQNGQSAYVPPAPVAASMQAKPKAHHAKTFWIAFGGAALACILVLACMTIYTSVTGKSAGTVSLGSSTNTTINASDEGEDRAEAVSEKALPSVVCIDVYTNESSSLSSLLSGKQSSTLTESSLGSGVIISTDGYILTNYHVIEDAAKLEVVADGTTYEAQVVGSDESSDLAVIKIDADNLTAIEIGSSSNLKQGQWVMSVGSPFGLEQSVATGIISATSRTVTASDDSSSNSYSGQSSSTTSSTPTVYANMIQTDAAINPGNSGGALVDQNGKLVGINALIESYSGNYSGVGFAIPVDYAIDIAQQIIAGKTPTHAQLGVAATTINSTIAQRYGLSVDQGAYVSEVYSGTGASDAGLQQGDIITKVNDTNITSATDLIAAVRTCNIGDTVTVTYNRSGSSETAQVKLTSDESTSSSKSSSSSSSSSNSSNSNSSSNGNSLLGGNSGSSNSNSGSSNGNGYSYGLSGSQSSLSNAA